MTEGMLKAMSIFMIVVAALVVIWVIWVTVQYCKDKSLDDIRADVYQLFLRAEEKFSSGDGEVKMAWVLEKAHDLLPGWLKVIISEDSFTRIVQIWFDGIKDLLDDGKLNGSIVKEEAENEEVENETAEEAEEDG